MFVVNAIILLLSFYYYAIKWFLKWQLVGQEDVYNSFAFPELYFCEVIGYGKEEAKEIEKYNKNQDK